MLNKTILATAVALAMGAAVADLTIGGKYEGTTNFDVDTSTLTYGQELDLKLSTAVLDNPTTVTASVDNLDVDSTFKLSELYIETDIQGLKAKMGKFKGQNGIGLMQKESVAANQVEATGALGGFGVTVGTVSGSGDATIDGHGAFGPLAIIGQNLTESNRFVTISGNLGDIGGVMEYQKTSVGTNVGLQATGSIEGLQVTYAQVDVEDAAGVTQDDGILEDISDAATGKVVRGVIVSAGDITGKFIDKNDKTTWVATLDQGIMEYGYSKTEDSDGVISALATYEF